MGNYVYRKGNGKSSTTDKLVKTFNINGQVESIREMKRILKGISDDRKLTSGVKVKYNTETGIKTLEPIGITSITAKK